MIVPDIEMICEIMLFSEGFEDAHNLARKFMLLFRLNKASIIPNPPYSYSYLHP